MSDHSFTVHGDEALEARIVSWVLGEASAFEAAELERLCEERPELLVFKRRMRALHGLLTEAEARVPDRGWALPDAKRRALDELFGTAPEKPLDLTIERRLRRSGRRALLMIAACLVLTAVIAGLMAPAAMRQRKKASRESPASVTYQAMMADDEAAEGQALAEASRDGKKLLETEFPPELIEGTPKPIILPGINAPAKEKKDLLATDSRRMRMNAEVPKPTAPAPPPASRPAAPGASMASVLPSERGAAEIPLAENAAATADFGDADSFGAGWGDSPAGGMGGGGIAARETALRSEPHGGRSEIQAGATAPADLPVLGRLFNESMAEEAPARSHAAAAYGYAAGADSSALMAGGEMKALDGNTRRADELAAAAGAFPTPPKDEAARPSVLTGQALAKAAPESPELAELRKAIRDQEDKVEERRKVLATIVRTKGIISEGSESFYSQNSGGVDGDQDAYQADEQRLKRVEAMKQATRDSAIRRGLDSQDFVDVKKEFENDQELLQQMKLRLAEAAAEAEPEAPLLDPASLIEEVSAAADPYSTFSLNISDASFQIAQAALARGEQPDPAGIKVEQFYNAVDYGDPSPAAGEPVSAFIEQAAHPVIPGRNLVRIALKTAAAGRSASQPLRLTLVVDQSGSMVREDRREAMHKALAGLAGLLTANDRVSVIGFSRTPRLLADAMPGDKAGNLAELVHSAASEGGTNLDLAIQLAGQMAARRMLAGAQNRIVLFTDGAANLGDADPVRLAEKIKVLRQMGIAFDIAGIAADDLNDSLLGELARHGNGRYYVVGKGADDDLAKQLAGAFRPAAENVKVQVRFNPERVARYKLIGFEQDRLKTEDFRNDAVDAAELAAEEAGVAIYQIEPIPGGSGEVGELGVRFRDTASGRMVERSWTIPHDAAAPVIDRASPAMQLAVLAMLAGEKLRGGPLAEAIDFNRLTSSRAAVRDYFGAAGRAAEVLRMVEALK